MRATVAAAALLAALLPPIHARAEEPPPGELDEVVVTGERTGPGLWHVHRLTGPGGGAAQVWILGTVSPLPKGITWRSRQVEQVLGDAEAVLVSKPLSVGVARALWILLTHRDLLMVQGGRRLKDVLPPDLYARFAAQRARYTTDPEKWERFRPIIAAAFLEESALHKVGLSTRLDLVAEVRDLARKHDVPVEEIKVAGVRDLLDTLKTVPSITENKCVGAGLSTIESGLPQLVDRANAWAAGDVDRVQSVPESAEDVACREAVSTDSGSADLLAQIRRAWLAGLEQHLRGSGVTLAVVNVDFLLEHGGLLDELRSRGYEVEAP